jgi:hypothetical protein
MRHRPRAGRPRRSHRRRDRIVCFRLELRVAPLDNGAGRGDRNEPGLAVGTVAADEAARPASPASGACALEPRRSARSRLHTVRRKGPQQSRTGSTVCRAPCCPQRRSTPSTPCSRQPGARWESAQACTCLGVERAPELRGHAVPRPSGGESDVCVCTRGALGGDHDRHVPARALSAPKGVAYCADPARGSRSCHHGADAVGVTGAPGMAR